MRDRPTQREELFAEFTRALEAIGASFVEISGEGLARTELATRAVTALLAERVHSGDVPPR